jgi:hypothetical protein
MILTVDVDAKTLNLGPQPPVLSATVTGALAFVRKGVPFRLPSGTGILIGLNSWVNPGATLLASAIPVRPAADGSPYSYSLSLDTAPLIAKFTAGVTSYDCQIEVEWEKSVGSGTYDKTARKKLSVDATAIPSGSVTPVPLAAANDFFVSSGTGLTVDVAAGKLGGSIIAAQPGVVITNATNYVELNGSGVAAVNTSGWTSGYYPLAVVVASAGAISSNSDRRAWLNGGISGTVSIATGKMLWVDSVNGSDANAGTFTAPFLTLAAAKAAAVSGDTVSVRPGSYTVTASILKNGVNWHFEAGASVSKSITGANPVGILDDGGTAIASDITGEGVFTTTSTSSDLHGTVKTSHASSVVTVHARRISAAQTTGDGGYPSAVFCAAGTLSVECSESISASDPTATAFGLAVYWSNGSLYVRAPKIFATESAYYGDCTSTPTGDAFVSADDMYGTATGYSEGLSIINDASSNSSAASWIVAKTIRSPVAAIPSVSGIASFASRLYVTAQKLFGSVQNLGTGLLYVNAEKITATANGAIGNPALVYSTGGTTRITCRHYDPVSFTSQTFKVTGGTLFLRGGDFTSGASAKGLEATGGTMFIENMVIDTSGNNNTNGVTVSGGTVFLINCRITGNPSAKDIVNSGGTVNVTGGSGSGTGGNFTTTGTVAYYFGVPDITVSPSGISAKSIVLNGSASGSTNITVPAAAGSTNFILPASTGTSGYFLQTDGSGNTTWQPGNGATVTVADEAADTSCYPVFVTAATGNLAPKSNAGLSFNSATGILAATGFSGPLNGIIGGTTPAAGTFTTGIFGSATSLLLGTAGSAVGSVGFRNATSGTITLSPPTGALGTVAVVLPATPGTLALTSDIPAAVSGANPSASVGLSAVNGSATTYLRSDGAPALDVTIAPTWTGIHTFASAVSTGTTTTSGIVFTGNSLTTGTGIYVASSSLTSGKLLDLQMTGNGPASGSPSVLNIGLTGANTTNAITTTGATISNTRTNATSGTNEALVLTASGATTNNYALRVTAGAVKFPANAGNYINGNATAILIGTTTAITSCENGNGFGCIIGDPSNGGGMALGYYGTFLANYGRYSWSSASNASPNNANFDTVLTRASAGVVQVGTTDNNALGSLLLTNLTASGIIVTTPNALTYSTNPTAISVATPATKLTTTGTGNAFSLANGTADGQRKTIALDVKGGGGDTAIVTPTTCSGFTTATLAAVGDTVEMMWVTTRGWMVTASKGTVIA